MKWTTSDVIALVAVIASAVSPIASSFFNWWKIKDDHEQKANEAKLEIKKENYREFLDHYRKAFEDYAVQTQSEISSPNFKEFTVYQKNRQAVVMIYADKEVIDAINTLNSQISYAPANTQGNFNAVIRAFNSQWQKAQPKAD